MSEMVERVAKEMAESAGQRMWQDVSDPNAQDDREWWMSRARAAIEAMREPTDRMRLAGSFAQDTPWAIYDAMISAALADDQAMALSNDVSGP